MLKYYQSLSQDELKHVFNELKLKMTLNYLDDSDLEKYANSPFGANYSSAHQDLMRKVLDVDSLVRKS